MTNKVPKELIKLIDPEWRDRFCERGRHMEKETFVLYIGAAWARIAINKHPRIGNDSSDYYVATILDPAEVGSYGKFLKKNPHATRPKLQTVPLA